MRWYPLNQEDSRIKLYSCLIITGQHSVPLTELRILNQLYTLKKYYSLYKYKFLTSILRSWKEVPWISTLSSCYALPDNILLYIPFQSSSHTDHMNTGASNKCFQLVDIQQEEIGGEYYIRKEGQDLKCHHSHHQYCIVHKTASGNTLHIL